jgi:hypothetical protein
MIIEYGTQDAVGAERPPAVETRLGAIFVSMELSRSTWLITSLLGLASIKWRDSVSVGSPFFELNRTEVIQR